MEKNKDSICFLDRLFPKIRRERERERERERKRERERERERELY
jgi:hypothetical protein